MSFAHWPLRPEFRFPNGLYYTRCSKLQTLVVIFQYHILGITTIQEITRRELKRIWIEQILRTVA